MLPSFRILITRGSLHSQNIVPMAPGRVHLLDRAASPVQLTFLILSPFHCSLSWTRCYFEHLPFSPPISLWGTSCCHLPWWESSPWVPSGLFPYLTHAATSHPCSWWSVAPSWGCSGTILTHSCWRTPKATGSLLPNSASAPYCHSIKPLAIGDLHVLHFTGLAKGSSLSSALFQEQEPKSAGTKGWPSAGCDFHCTAVPAQRE